MTFYIYIIQSQVDKTYYKGFTENYFERIKSHNAGLSMYTARKTPWRLVYLEKFEDKKAALIREKKIKKYSHEQIQNLINSPANRCKGQVEEWLKSLPNNVGDETDVRC